MISIKKPEWLKIKIKSGANTGNVSSILKKYTLNTVCAEADCPNVYECFSRGTATFMILGKNCTRNCKFCKVIKAEPEEVNPIEPKNIAKAIKEMDLKHTVITSVTRDDLSDGGAGHFASTISEIKNLCPNVTIEVLIPDFKGEYDSLKKVVEAKPDVLNHNVETISNLYSSVRPMAVYKRSLELLKRVKEIDDSIFTKSGFMVGLGENAEQVIELLKDLKKVNCDIITIGQYLQPTKEHYEVKEYVNPNKFKIYEIIAKNMGFKFVASGPFVRSSYHAEDGLNSLN